MSCVTRSGFIVSLFIRIQTMQIDWTFGSRKQFGFNLLAVSYKNISHFAKQINSWLLLVSVLLDCIHKKKEDKQNEQKRKEKKGRTSINQKEQKPKLLRIVWIYVWMPNFDVKQKWLFIGQIDFKSFWLCKINFEKRFLNSIGKCYTDQRTFPGSAYGSMFHSFWRKFLLFRFYCTMKSY